MKNIATFKLDQPKGQFGEHVLKCSALDSLIYKRFTITGLKFNYQCAALVWISLN